jgi:hypothetical protein
MQSQHELGMLILANARKQQEQADAARLQSLMALPGLLQGIFNKSPAPVEEPAPDFERVDNVNSDNVASMPIPSGKLDINKIMHAIGQFESGDNYGSRGVPTKSGDRAYGKYQIMGSNIPVWSKEALGRTVTTNEFLANPEIQDAIAQAKMKAYLDKYGNVGDVASAWFSGRPLRNNFYKDILGTSVPDYVKAISKYF